MTEFEELVQNQFFVIDSENFENVKSRLYGFALHDGRIIQNEDVEEEMKLGGGYVCMGKIHVK